MTRHAFAAAFMATIGVAVPAGWHLIDADLHTDGKHVRNLQQTMIVDGVTVTLDVDRAIVSTGDSVTATLVATAPVAHDVKIELTAFTADDNPGERVGPTPRAIDHENLTLHAAPAGGTPVKTKLVLGSTKERPGHLDDFQIYITPRGTKALAPDGRSYVATDDNKAAAASVLAWSGDTIGIRIEPRPPKTPEDPFVIAVHVKNPNDTAIAPYVNLGTQLAEYGGATRDDNDETAPLITPLDDGTTDREVAPHAERVFAFQIQPAGPAHDVALIADAHWGADMGVRPQEGGLDVKVIHLPAGATDDDQPPPQPVASK